MAGIRCCLATDMGLKLAFRTLPALTGAGALIDASPIRVVLQYRVAFAADLFVKCMLDDVTGVAERTK